MHAVHFVDDDALPAGHDFAVVAIPDGALVFLRATAVTEANLEAAWAAYRVLRDTMIPRPPTLIPQPRPLVYAARELACLAC